MKYLKLYEEFNITESIATPILFHFTKIESLYNILKNNTLNLSHNLGSKVDEYGKKIYYMSFTRTKSTKSGYGTKFINPNAVRITFDGTKLNNNYKFLPVDYWGYEKTLDIMNRPSTDETEDRLVSDKESIPNANKYIKRIDVFIDKDGVVKDILDNSKKLGIDIYFYDNLKDFEIGNSNKLITPNIKIEGEEESVYNKYIDYELLGILSYNNHNIIPILKDKIVNLDMSLIEEYHEKLKIHLKYESEFDDIRIHITQSLNSLKNHSNPINRFIVFEIGKEYKKLGATSVKDYLTKKKNIGKKTQQDFNKEFCDNVIEYIDIKVQEYISGYYVGGYIDDEEVDNLLEVEDFVNDYKKIVNEIKNYIKDYISNNDDMYRYIYLISRDDLKEKLNIKDKINELKNRYQADDDLNLIINYLISDIDNFLYEEKKRFVEEDFLQWNR
jgi:hypothetical protein